ncbi:unnamed protein product [Cyprideis torosa]|uniref:Secretory carrier-associated membrane protein n=1 Tax=Cyprideis torosa TaxID=163714 RepID=A0A7R8ZME7_9CRUS|nr:unnamed protein product [Cyprideis torosa]CAG0888665.1 unnamed protein product [Cyprideis torosa]
MDDNPFADPSVTGVQKVPMAQPTGVLEDYNPFDDSTGVSAPQYKPIPGQGANAPTLASPTAESAPIRPTVAELEKRQQELEQRARELEAREEALRGGAINIRANNWPPLPSGFCVGPCFYQDINVDIPPEMQRIVRHLYYVWISHAALYLLNIVVASALMFQAGEGKTFGLSLFYGILFIPLSYVCWFRPIYKAFRSDSSFNFFIFFFVFFFQLCVTVIQAAGIPGMGTCGIINGLETITNKEHTAGYYVVGAMTLLMGVGFGIVAFLDFLLLVKVHRIYRSSDASFAKAQQEFASGVFKNETFRNAAQEATSQAVRAQVESATRRY